MTDSTSRTGTESHTNGSSRDPVEGRAQALGILRVDESDPAPAYVQLERGLRMAVADGVLQPGDQLPSVCQLAQHLRVSPNTVGRAYADLSREGVIVAKAGGGSAVAPLDRIDLPGLERTRQERLQLLARQAAVRGLALGFEHRPRTVEVTLAEQTEGNLTRILHAGTS
ncbi:MAG: GntR family transcriptional regulator [Chloroflexota bacterium]|nr:GntR family transcriptional regulator [Chloroflexota bacterium]